MSKKTVIDQPAFERMLSWLNPDHEKAAQKYASIHHRLVEIFASRHFVDAEQMADDAMDRVTRKVPQIEEGWEGDPKVYFLAVAKKIVLEASKPRPSINPPSPPPDPDRLEREDRCLDKCLAALLEPDERILILEYIVGNKEQRHDQAEKLGITLNALRIRVCQTKKIISPCIKDCMKEEAA